jgi:thiopeptide-type bacteriocin biosynthesis protein
VGTVGGPTRLSIEGRDSYQRHTRLDMDYLTALTAALSQDRALRDALLLRPNSSLYLAAGRLRYVESRLDGKSRSYHLAAIEPTDYLFSTLARAANGAPLADLARALCEADPEVTADEAAEYIAALIDNQVLVSDFGLAVTGPEPVHRLIAQIRDVPPIAGVAQHLNQAQEAIAHLDGLGLGSSPDLYRGIARTLEALPAKVELPRLFQVDLHKPAPNATLGTDILDPIIDAVGLLHRIAPKRAAGGALERFRDAFRQRYETREVPLVEALDEESGIGFDSSSAPGAEGSPLLEGLVFPPSGAEESGSWTVRDAFLLAKLTGALKSGAEEISLQASDLDALETRDPAPLPDAFMVIAKVIGAPNGGAPTDGLRVIVAGLDGPSGAKLLGRFCHGDPQLTRFVEQHLRAEEAFRPEAIYAEIVHFPEGRIGNVLLRPVLREYEITYLGLSGAPREKQIPVADLLVSVIGSRIVLRSARLGKEVIPRMTNAHNYGLRSLGMYRFLCALQNDGIATGLGFSWGALESAPFLPRIVSGRKVLGKARWRLTAEDIQSLANAKGDEAYRAVQRLREKLGLPRLVSVADGDNTLLVDLDNVLSVETFIHLVKGRAAVRLEEVLPAPADLCVDGPEGSFVHELVIPFVRKESTAQPKIRSRTTAPAGIARSLQPGSAWLYAKLYTGTSGVDQILRSVVAPVVRSAMGSGAADRWFFIRYGDPDWHLRLRLHGAPERLLSEVLVALQSAVGPLVSTGQVWRFQLDTYEQELERYGGPEGIVIAEKIFHADSEAALGMVELLYGDEGADARWRLAMRGMDALLEDLGLDLERKLLVVKAAREVFGKEFRTDGRFEHQLGDKYRKERASLEQLLDPGHDKESPLAPGLALIHERSARIKPLASELRVLEEAGSLLVTAAELAQSFLHMHANRMLRSAARAQELVMYDFLARTYESLLARARKTPPSTSRVHNV